jgi:hypothetical protein
MQRAFLLLAVVHSQGLLGPGTRCRFRGLSRCGALRHGIVSGSHGTSVPLLRQQPALLCLARRHCTPLTAMPMTEWSENSNKSSCHVVSADLLCPGVAEALSGELAENLRSSPLSASATLWGARTTPGATSPTVHQGWHCAILAGQLYIIDHISCASPGAKVGIRYIPPRTE